MMRVWSINAVKLVEASDLMAILDEVDGRGISDMDGDAQERGYRFNLEGWSSLSRVAMVVFGSGLNFFAQEQANDFCMKNKALTMRQFCAIRTSYRYSQY
eukprot:scaffold166572_cov50-Attheya_sp.AAC.1